MGGVGGSMEQVARVPGTESFNCEPGDNSALSVKLTQVVADLSAPVGVEFAPGDLDRAFIVTAPGRVELLQNGSLAGTPFLDLSERIERDNETYEERGLLSMAFDPDYATTGRFYVHYTTGGEASGNLKAVLSSFRVSGDANVADAGSESVLREVDEPFNNHNGGGLNFGSDGNLYWGLGDGGWSGVATADQNGNAQNSNSLLGSILRLTPEGQGAPGNMPGALPEVWDIGVRNPWRVSFDGCTGDMYIGDPGFESESTATEEVNVEPAMAGHRNYGWPIMEGDSCREDGCDMSAFTLPTDSYPQQTGAAMIGGYVYRGSAIPALRGKYVYGDYSQGRFWAFRYANGAATDKMEISGELNPDGFSLGTLISFGQDRRGELYVLVWSDGDPKTVGRLYRIDPE